MYHRMPGIPVISIAGLLGSLLWLMWLILIGIAMLKKRAGRVRGFHSVKEIRFIESIR
jgi:hypothetical protein